MKFNKHTIYISLFAVLYLIVAFSSFWHAVAFFGLANNTWMSVILALAFEIGQSAVLFSLLTSKKDRGRIMPWVLMTMFTLVQVIGNIYSSYKYIITNSVENLRYFKEPIFIWTELPDAQANVIIVYLVGALLPIASLLLTSMITNYLTDIEEAKNQENKPLIDQENIDKLNKVIEEAPQASQIINEENPLINQNSILEMENQGLQESLENKDKELDSLKEELKSKQELIDTQNQKIDNLDREVQELVKEKFDNEPKNDERREDKSDNNGEESLENASEQTEEAIPEVIQPNDEEQVKEENTKSNKLVGEDINDKSGYLIGEPGDQGITDENLKVADALMGGNILNKPKKDSHFINKP